MKNLIALAPLALGLLSGCAEQPAAPDNVVVLDDGPINPDCELAKKALKDAVAAKNYYSTKANPAAKPETIDTSVLARCRTTPDGAFLARRGSEQWYALTRAYGVFSADPRFVYSSENGAERWVSLQDAKPASAKQTADLQRLFKASKEIK